MKIKFKIVTGIQRDIVSMDKARDNLLVVR